MIRIFLLLVVLVAIVAGVLHISAGWAWIVVIGGIVGYVIYLRSKPGSGGATLVKPSAAWKCPFCLKRVKIGATACHHCGRSMLKEP